MSIFESIDFSGLLLIVLAAVAIKTTVLAIVAWCVTKLARVESVTTQHQVAKFVLWGMLLMPLLVFFIPSIPLPELTQVSNVEPASADAVPFVSESKTLPNPKSEAVSPANSTAPLKTAAAPPVASSISTVPNTAVPLAKNKNSASSFSIKQFLAAVYLIVSAVLLIRLLLGWLHTLRLAHTATKADLPTEQQCRYPVFASERIAVPATIGIVTPKILLPSDWNSWTESDVDMALAHESSHVQRRDALMTLLATFTATAR